MTVQLYLGDCLEVMKALPDRCMDAVVTDPPYGIKESGRKNVTRSHLAKAKDYGNYNWDTVRIDKAYIIEMCRISCHQVIFGGNFYTDMLPPSSSWIVWDKNNTGDFADCELAWTSHKKAVRKFKWTWNGFIKECPEERFHPTQKPLELMKWVIQNYTHSNSIILDPFMGSGTTGVACVQLKRNFIGIEIDPAYYAIAEKRITEAQEQLSFL